MSKKNCELASKLTADMIRAAGKLLQSGTDEMAAIADSNVMESEDDVRRVLNSVEKVSSASRLLAEIADLAGSRAIGFAMSKFGPEFIVSWTEGSSPDVEELRSAVLRATISASLSGAEAARTAQEKPPVDFGGLINSLKGEVGNDNGTSN